MQQETTVGEMAPYLEVVRVEAARRVRKSRGADVVEAKPVGQSFSTAQATAALALAFGGGPARRAIGTQPQNGANGRAFASDGAPCVSTSADMIRAWPDGPIAPLKAALVDIVTGDSPYVLVQAALNHLSVNEATEWAWDVLLAHPGPATAALTVLELQHEAAMERWGRLPVDHIRERLAQATATQP